MAHISTLTRKKKKTNDLIFRRSNSTKFPPIKIKWKIISRQNGCFISMSWILQPTFSSTQKPIPELGLSQIGEPSHTMYSSGVQFLVTLCTAQVSLEDVETVIMLLLSGVGFVESFFEEREMLVWLR